MKKIFLFLICSLLSVNLFAYGGDGLGDHKARKALNMNGKDINSVLNLTIQENINNLRLFSGNWASLSSSMGVTGTFRQGTGSTVISMDSGWFNAAAGCGLLWGDNTYVGGTDDAFVGITVGGGAYKVIVPLTGNMTVPIGITVSTLTITGGTLVGTGGQFDIKMNTVDASDNGVLIVSGGGAGDASRGGYLELFGNESSNGMARLYSGSGGSAYIGLHTGSGVLRQKIDNVGNFYFSPTSNQFTSTATASLWDFNNNTNTRETAIAKNIVVTTGTIGTLVITNSLISPVEYSTVTLLAVFTSTGNTTASMNTQYVDLPICFDYTPKEWECWANTAGTFTVSLTTAAFGNTPVFGNSIAGTDSPSLAGTQCSSSTALSGWGGNIPQGYCLRMTVTSAATIDQVTLKICVWKRR